MGGLSLEGAPSTQRNLKTGARLDQSVRNVGGQGVSAQSRFPDPPPGVVPWSAVLYTGLEGDRLGFGFGFGKMVYLKRYTVPEPQRSSPKRYTKTKHVAARPPRDLSWRSDDHVEEGCACQNQGWKEIHITIARSINR